MKREYGFGTPAGTIAYHAGMLGMPIMLIILHVIPSDWGDGSILWSVIIYWLIMMIICLMTECYTWDHFTHPRYGRFHPGLYLPLLAVMPFTPLLPIPYWLLWAPLTILLEIIWITWDTVWMLDYRPYEDQ